MNEFRQRPMLSVMARTVALVAGLLVLVLSVLLISDHVRLLQMDPLNDPVLLELRETLAAGPEIDESVVEQIRTYDLYARRAFFSNQEQRRSGGLLLLGGALVCFAALKLSLLWRPELPAVGKINAPDHWAMNALFRQLMAGTGIFLVVISLFLAVVVQSDLAVVMSQSAAPAVAAIVPGGGAAPQSVVSPEAFMANWPNLRGPGGYGVAPLTDAPVQWDVKSGEGVLWSVAVGVQGFNSPVVWDKRVFMTGANNAGQQVLCYDADTGVMLWSKVVETAVDLPKVSEDVGLAAPTMATDGQRVFAIFASGELAAFDFEGRSVWQRNIGVPDNPYGMGSSLISDGERLFVQYDHDNGKRVMAYDCATGEQTWRAERTRLSWATPMLIKQASGPQLILNDEANVTAYDPTTGKQLWQVSCLGGEVAPSPAFNGKDIVFVANEYAQATALKLTGGTPEVLWQYDNLLPDIASPVAGERLFFIATSAGDLVCLDAKTGDAKWERESDEGFSSSPVLVGDRLYVIDVTGVMHIVKAADDYRQIARIEMGDPVHATPAFVNGRIYIRSNTRLTCIGQ